MVSASSNPSLLSTPRDASADGAKVNTRTPEAWMPSTASIISVVFPTPAPPRMAVTKSRLLHTCRTAACCCSFRKSLPSAGVGRERLEPAAAGPHVLNHGFLFR